MVSVEHASGPAAAGLGKHGEVARATRPRGDVHRNAAAAGAGIAIALLLVVVAATRVQGGAEGRRAVLEEARERLGSAREQYDHAEKVMKAALEQAHDYEQRCVCVGVEGGSVIDVGMTCTHAHFDMCRAHVTPNVCRCEIKCSKKKYAHKHAHSLT